MKQSPILLFFILILATPAFGQDAVIANDRQKFSGIWILDAKKSDRAFRDIYKGQTLEISHNEPELKIVKTYTFQNQPRTATLVLFTDNRGEKNIDRLEITSNTFWEKNNLIRTYTIKIYNSGKVVGGHAVKETYTISEDGETLTMLAESRSKIRTDSRYGELKTDHKGKHKMVYQRKK